MDKLNITLHSVKQAKKYENETRIAGFIVGDNKFGLRQVTDFTLDDISKLRENTKKNIIVAVNKIMHNHELDDLQAYLQQLAKIGVDSVIFSDLAVLQIIKTNDMNLGTIYNTETTITNQYFTTLAKQTQMSAVELAKEINLKEIIEIAQNKECPISINIHAHIYMYQSIRKLISNYSEFQSEDYKLNKDYYLYDEERDNYYPIVQNEQGTHLLASSDVCLINRLDKIVNNQIDFLQIDGFGYKENEIDAIIKLYLEAFEMLENDLEVYKTQKKELLTNVKNIVPHKKMGTGFYFKKTVF